MNQTWYRRPAYQTEQVAILDRHLEESTRDFDGIIYDEEQRQRERPASAPLRLRNRR